MKYSIIVLGPGKRTRGGITSVIKAHNQTQFWKKRNCVWVETYIDKNSITKLFYFFKGYLLFLFYLRNAKFIHIHFSEPTSAYRKSFFFNTAILFKKIIILHFHAFSVENTLFGARKNLYSKMFSRANAIIALSSYWKDQISLIIDNPNKIHIIYNPCSLIRRQPDSNKQKVILFAGTLNKRKGYSDLIRAFSLISQSHKDWKVIFAGNGEIENAKLLGKELKIENQLIFSGWVEDKEKDDLYNSASIFCLPSYAEGFPMAVLDAWSYAIPVVTTPVGGLPDILINNVNALVFNAGDILTLSSQLSRLMSDDDLRNRLSLASFHLSQDKFSITKISSQLDKLYENLA